MKMKKILSIVSFAIFLPSLTLAATYSYTPMETIPGFGKPTSFSAYISAVYKFGLWTIGISALLMITLGGYMYLTSAGNTSQTGKAKGVITDAIIGIILALFSWLLLYTINPDLINLTAADKVNMAIETAATNYDGTYPKIESTLPSDCKSAEWKAIFEKASASTGVDKCILEATAAKESCCKQVPARTQGGRDCSVMQIAAQANCGASCETLEANPQQAVECAAKYINTCSSKWRTNNEEQKVRDIYAGYNGGCGALAPSASCAGQTNSFGNAYQKWDCPKDCGGYCPVPARTTVFLNYYNQCKGQS